MLYSIFSSGQKQKRVNQMKLNSILLVLLESRGAFSGSLKYFLTAETTFITSAWIEETPLFLGNPKRQSSSDSQDCKWKTWEMIMLPSVLATWEVRNVNVQRISEVFQRSDGGDEKKVSNNKDRAWRAVWEDLTISWSPARRMSSKPAAPRRAAPRHAALPQPRTPHTENRHKKLSGWHLQHTHTTTPLCFCWLGLILLK